MKMEIQPKYAKLFNFTDIQLTVAFEILESV